jgi:hypothetical protein
MTTIFCSKELEKYIGKVDQYLEPDYNNRFGNWNAHLFMLKGHKYILFTNDKTTFSIVWRGVKKKDGKDIPSRFREAVIRQLDNDLKLNERQEIEMRAALADIRLTRTNNNKYVLGTMNEFIHVLKHFILSGDPAYLSDVELAYGVNNQFITGKLKGPNVRFAVPKELMLDLLLKI